MGLDWDRYDRWRWNSGTQEYEMYADNYIDMIYVQWRRVDPFGITWGGYGSSYVNYTTSDGKYITSYGLDYLGTGVTGVNGANMPIEAVIGLFRHEYCHYTLGDHKPYCTIAGGTGYESCGYEVGFSPMDMIAVGYDNTINFNPNTESYPIGDLHNTGDLIKIPTGTENEYFLVSNRRRIIGDGNGLIYDCNMAGDTAMGTPFLQFHDYSKGLYIYHVSNMDGFDFWADLECADGLWDWEYSHNTTPDWSPTQPLSVIFKYNVSYDEDNPFTSTISSSRMYSRDGHSVVNQNYGGAGYNAKWFSVGKRHENLGEQGIDRIFTNLEEDWCSRECMGDRWDAWVRDYNVVFSPYSSPNTKDRAGDQTGLFIYYDGLDENQVASIKIYQGDYNTQEEEYALEQTPPSRPMGLELTYTGCVDGKSFPVLTWNHNMEPDMKVPPEPVTYQYKRYKIFRATTEINNLPTEYELIADSLFRTDFDPCFIDSNAYIDCDGGLPVFDYRVRYKIIAVDKDELESEYSDFVATPASVIQKPGGNFVIPPNNAPAIFSLSQNFPNPFNPATQIKFTIPCNGFVNLRIYNLLGEEVAELVNGYKLAGEYNVNFDGSNLASGVYFYKLEMGLYTAVKKMVLIK